VIRLTNQQHQAKQLSTHRGCGDVVKVLGILVLDKNMRTQQKLKTTDLIQVKELTLGLKAKFRCLKA
jgi:hypothetical protein